MLVKIEKLKFNIFWEFRPSKYSETSYSNEKFPCWRPSLQNSNGLKILIEKLKISQKFNTTFSQFLEFFLKNLQYLL